MVPFLWLEKYFPEQLEFSEPFGISALILHVLRMFYLPFLLVLLSNLAIVLKIELWQVDLIAHSFSLIL